MTGNALTKAEPMLPGLMPEREADELMMSFRATSQGIIHFVSRLPTRFEREKLAKRRDDIARAMRAIRDSMTEQDDALQDLGGFLLGYGITRNNDRKAAETASAYLKELMDFPLFAIRAAIDDVKNNRVFDVDPKTGNKTRLSPDYPPSTTRMRMIAQKHVDTKGREKWEFDRVLAAKRAYDPPEDPKMRAKVEAGLKELTASMTATQKARIDAERNSVDAQRNRAAMAMRQRETILKEYEALGIAPVMCGSAPMSVTLARSLFPDRFTRVDAKMKKARR